MAAHPAGRSRPMTPRGPENDIRTAARRVNGCWWSVPPSALEVDATCSASRWTSPRHSRPRKLLPGRHPQRGVPGPGRPGPHHQRRPAPGPPRHGPLSRRPWAVSVIPQATTERTRPGSTECLPNLNCSDPTGRREQKIGSYLLNSRLQVGVLVARPRAAGRSSGSLVRFTSAGVMGGTPMRCPTTLLAHTRIAHPRCRASFSA